MGRRATTSPRLERPDLQLRIPFWRVCAGELHTLAASWLVFAFALDAIGAWRSGTPLDAAATLEDAGRSLVWFVVLIPLFELLGDASGRLTVVGKRLIIGAIPRLTRERVVRLDRVDVETRRWNDLPLALLGLRAIRQHGGPTRFIPWLWISRDDLDALVVDARYLAERRPVGAFAR